MTTLERLASLRRALICPNKAEEPCRGIRGDRRDGRRAKDPRALQTLDFLLSQNVTTGAKREDFRHTKHIFTYRSEEHAEQTHCTGVHRQTDHCNEGKENFVLFLSLLKLVYMRLCS